MFRRFLLMSALLALLPLNVQAERTRLSMNPDWRVNVGDVEGADAAQFDDAGWKKVSLPYAWNEDDAFKVPIDKLRTGISWYRKQFALPEGAEKGKVFIEFEGIRHAGQFYLNGKPIGSSGNGVMAFGFDVTDVVLPAPQVNVLCARIDSAWNAKDPATGNGYQWNDKNFYANYGGINKNVHLHLTDKLHQTLPLFSNLGTVGTYVYATNIDVKAKTAKVVVETEIINESKFKQSFDHWMEVIDRNGKTVGKSHVDQHTMSPGEKSQFTLNVDISDVDLWDWGHGSLYTVRSTLVKEGQPIDTVNIRTGFRKTQFSNGYLTLNDRPMQLKGYAQRTTNEWPAVGISIPSWMSDFSNALMVESNANLVRWMHVTPSKQDVESCDRVGLIQSMPAGDSEKDVTGTRWQQRKDVMRDAMIYNRNNPSILFYECGNNEISEEHMQEMIDLRNKFDPHGGRAIGSRNMQGSKIAEFGGEMLYINKSATKPMWAMEFSRDEGLRKYWDELTPPFHKNGDGPFYRNAPAISYNRNQDSHAIENVVRWDEYYEQRPGTGERVNGGGVNIIFSDSNTHYRGAENYRRSGEVDAMRIPKDGFFAHQVMWDGWVDATTPRAHIIGHWNYPAGTKKSVYVVSSAEKVQLLLNDKSLGYGVRSNRFLFTFDPIEFAPGTLRAVGFDAAGKQVCEAIKKTAGEPASVKLSIRTAPDGLKADGADLALVDVEVVDAQGDRCPTALNLINFDLQGPAEWRGGIAQGPDNYILAKSLPVECGVNRVIIRSTRSAGNISISASSKGLAGATIQLQSNPVKVENGLAVEATALPGQFVKTPTSQDMALPRHRKALKIASVSAGSSEEEARNTIDDNETTKWTSKGKNGGWIEFALQQPAEVNQVVLKLGNWRDRSYPLKITVDDKEVFSGLTPKSLGYVTLDCKPTTGSKLRIALTGAVSEGDAFGQVTELAQEKTATTRQSAGVLSIVEAEIYSK